MTPDDILRILKIRYDNAEIERGKAMELNNATVVLFYQLWMKEYDALIQEIKGLDALQGK